MSDKKYVSVFNAKLARKLIKSGQIVIDIKPMKENNDKSIFIFERNKETMNIIENSIESK